MSRRWFSTTPLAIAALTLFLASAGPLHAGWLSKTPGTSEAPANETTPTEEPEANDGANTEPTRIPMRGASSMPVKGSLTGEDELSYVVTLPPGMDLSIELECKPEKAVVPSLMGPDGKMAELRDEGGGTWMGAVPATEKGEEADFILYVKKGKAGPGTIPFALTVRVPELGDEGGGGEDGGAPSAAASQGKSDMRTVIAPSGLSLRAKPDPKSKKLAALPKGTVVEVISIDGPPDMYEGINAQWYNIRANGQEGWAFGGFIGEPGESPTPEGSGIRGAIFNQPWEKDANGNSLFQLSDPGTEKLKIQNQNWLTLEKGKTSGKFEFTDEGMLFYDGVFISRDFVAHFEGDSGAVTAKKLRISPTSPSGRQLIFTADADGGCVNEYLLNLDQGNIRGIFVAKYGSDPWIEWSKDGKSVFLKSTNEGEVRKFKVDLKTGKDELIETTQEGN